MHYKILYNKNVDLLVKDVNEHLKIGYRPSGNLVIQYDRTGNEKILGFIQPMIKNSTYA